MNKILFLNGSNFGEAYNSNPELLMEAATWWIMEHKLNHFEKAVKIKTLALGNAAQ